MLGLSANLNYYLFNGNVDPREGILRRPTLPPARSGE